MEKGKKKAVLFFAGLGLLLVFFYGCGVKKEQEPPAAFNGNEQIKEDEPVITLEKAMADGIVSVKVMDNQFIHKTSRFLLIPNVSTRPVILVREGWRLISPQTGVSSFITIRPHKVRLNADRSIDIDTVQENLMGNRDIRQGHEYGLERLPADSNILKLLKTAAAKADPPDWKAMQIAVWALSVDVDFKTVARTVLRMMDGRGKVINRISDVIRPGTSAELDNALDLLEDSGFDPLSFKVYTGARELLDHAVHEYWNGARPIQAINTISFFYTWEDAYQLLTSVFKDHPGKKGINIRRAAFFALASKNADQETLDFLQKKVDKERSYRLQKIMATRLKLIK